MTELPKLVAEMVEILANLPGTIAVVLGGSQSVGTADSGSDWDLGLYYRGAIDLTALAVWGTVHPPGAWGRLMNGGAWLRFGDLKVDVMLRDLDTVEHWTRRAEKGEFEVDLLLGYLAGVPSYFLTGELASCRVLWGEIPIAPFPAALRASGPPQWRFSRSFSLDYARMHARRGNPVGAGGQAAKAIMEEAHARLCEQGRWVCNEKRILEAAGLVELSAPFAQIPPEAAELLRWVDQVADQLGVQAGEVTPWNDGGRVTKPT